MPCLGSQVACPSDFFGLACHAFDTNWHATPLCSSGTPIVIDGSGVPRPFFSGVPHPYACFESLLWTLVLACHALLLECYASAFLWRLLQVSCQFHMPSFLFVFYPIFDAFFT
ncbi:hypothetical protein AHAS_Ahas12G0097800 [Arachis hypogaea]